MKQKVSTGVGRMKSTVLAFYIGLFICGFNILIPVVAAQGNTLGSQTKAGQKKVPAPKSSFAGWSSNTGERQNTASPSQSGALPSSPAATPAADFPAPDMPKVFNVPAHLGKSLPAGGAASLPTEVISVPNLTEADIVAMRRKAARGEQVFLPAEVEVVSPFKKQ